MKMKPSSAGSYALFSNERGYLIASYFEAIYKHEEPACRPFPTPDKHP